MDLARYFHISFFDLKPLLSRRAVILLLMAVFLYQASGIFYKGLTLKMLAMSPPPAAETKDKAPVVAARKSIETYTAIAERNIFGTSMETVAAKQAQKKPDQQDPSLLFDLRGTAAGEGKFGFAVIEDKKTKKQRLIKVGDVVSGARILRIRRNSIDMLVDDQTRTMKMAERTEQPIIPPAAAKPAAAVVSGGKILVNRSEISSALADIGQLLRQARVRPYFYKGAPEGFMITDIQPGSLYQKMGIANGDIIQGVDGRPIKTADDMTSFINTLKEASNVVVSLKRQGREQTLNYQLR